MKDTSDTLRGKKNQIPFRPFGLKQRDDNKYIEILVPNPENFAQTDLPPTTIQLKESTTTAKGL